jgi:hypothetical protein
MTESTIAEGRWTSAIGRITQGRTRWRVLVDTWTESDGYHGRLRFVPDPAVPESVRETAAVLHGGSREDVLVRAYELGEARWRRMLLSLV